MDEVLDDQPEPARRFLSRSAVLDRLTGPLCDAVTGDHDGREMLTALERANLFVVPLDDRREWYRFHHLFADVLRAHLLAEQPELVPVLHERASQWYEQHELTDESVRHAMAAGDIGRVVHLMELAVASVRRNRQESAFMGWLKALPDEAVRRSPVLSVFSAYAYMASGELDGVEPRLVDAERELARISTGSERPWADTDELRTLPGTIASTGRRSPRREETYRPPRSRPVVRWSWPGPPTTSLEEAPPVSSDRPPGRTATSPLHWRRSRRQLAACTPPALSSTSSAAPSFSPTCGSPPDDQAPLSGSTSGRCARAEAHGDAVARAAADLHVGLSETEASPAETLSDRELRVLRLLDSELSGPEIARHEA